ncbi:MAG: GntR family transcriptional regulator [Hyphomicrobiales bacterium]
MTQRSADRIRENLEEAIIAGEFADGERLDEVSLSLRYAVSRTPVREALHALSASGLVEHMPRRGVFVRYPSVVKLIEMFEVMAELEAMCCRRAARRITDDDLAALETALRQCDEASRGGDSDEYYRRNEQFHHCLYAASGNGFLAEEASRLHKRLRPFRRLQLQVRNRIDQSMEEHRAVFQAIRNGDPEAAATTIRQHVAIQGEKFHDLIASYNRAPQRRAGRELAGH